VHALYLHRQDDIIPYVSPTEGNNFYNLEIRDFYNLEIRDLQRLSINDDILDNKVQHREANRSYWRKESTASTM